MAKREDARYDFSVKALRVRALNDDLTQVAPDNIIGGAGPFDFSGQTATAVPLSVKIDGVLQEVDVDISSAVSQSAVTVDELVTALTAVFTSETVALTASKDSTSNRLKIVASETPKTVQLFDDCAYIAKIGQGFGTKFIYSDTIKSVGGSPKRKDSESISNTDANGYDVEVITEGYYKGETGTIADTAVDWDLKGLLEGHLPDDATTLSSPVSTDVRPFIKMEVVSAKYRRGQNYEGEQVGYCIDSYFKVKGMTGDKTKDRNFNDSNYSYEALTYVDSNNVEQSAWQSVDYTNEAFAALDFDNV